MQSLIVDCYLLVKKLYTLHVILYCYSLMLKEKGNRTVNIVCVTGANG